MGETREQDTQSRDTQQDTQSRSGSVVQWRRQMSAKMNTGWTCAECSEGEQGGSQDTCRGSSQEEAARGGEKETPSRAGRSAEGVRRLWHVQEFQQVRVAAAGNEGEYLQAAGGERGNQTTWDSG